MTKFWGRGELFRQNCHRKYVISTGKPMALPTFWAIDRTCSSKNWRSCGDLKIWPIFLPGDLVPWPTYKSMSHTRTAHPFHMWTKFGDDMWKRSWVMLDKTDRQTDRQTNRKTNILAKNCKFWQVMSTVCRTTHTSSHWGWDKMDAILQMMLSDAFYWMKMYQFHIIFHWNLFLRFELTML